MLSPLSLHLQSLGSFTLTHAEDPASLIKLLAGRGEISLLSCQSDLTENPSCAFKQRIPNLSVLTAS